MDIQLAASITNSKQTKISDFMSGTPLVIARDTTIEQTVLTKSIEIKDGVVFEHVAMLQSFKVTMLQNLQSCKVAILQSWNVAKLQYYKVPKFQSYNIAKLQCSNVVMLPAKENRVQTDRQTSKQTK